MKPSSFLTRLLSRMSPVRSSRSLPSPQPLTPLSSEADHPLTGLTINDAKGDFVCPFLMPQCDEDPDAPTINLWPKDHR